jgi:hypothetical protein
MKLQNTAGFVVGSSDGSTIWGGRNSWCKLQECRAIYAQYKTAEQEIKDIQKNGGDVSDLVVFPVTIVLQKAIAPTVRKEPKGFVIEFKRVYRDHTGKRKTHISFWKGNKKSPNIITTYNERKPDGSWGYSAEIDPARVKSLFYTYQDTAFKASVFKTHAEAQRILTVFLTAQMEALEVTYAQFEPHVTDYGNHYDPRLSYDARAKLREDMIKGQYKELMFSLKNASVSIQKV